MEAARKRLSKRALSTGSALILAVVLTSLLAIVGVMFLMISRIDRMATSAISEDKQLDLAVDTVLGRISRQLAWDVPGVNVPGWGLPEYHDYPGPNDVWLASSEPYQAGTDYFWRHISDIYDKFGANAFDLPIEIIPDYQDSSIMVEGLPADADGDGIADSRWVIIPGITSSRGEPVYAAIRITDNCGKININTAFKFDPNDPAIVDPFDPYDPNISGIDGTSLLHVNLMALATWPGTLPTPADANALLWARANYGVNLYPTRLDLYENNVIWQYGELPMPYTPFDISDELELRNRFILNQRDTNARIERFGWGASDSFLAATTLDVPIGSASSSIPVADERWFDRAFIFSDFSDPNYAVRVKRYDYRHLATTYSMDRIINPVGGKMANVNRDTGDRLYLAIIEALWDVVPTLPDPTAGRLAAQIAANVKDFGDDDSVVTTVQDVLDPNLTVYYGFERPCIYISEVAGMSDSNGNNISYAVELYKPYSEDDPPFDPDPNDPGNDSGWQLVVDSNGVRDTVDIHWLRTGTGYFHVIIFEGPTSSPLAGTVDMNDSDIQYSTEFGTINSIHGGGTIYLQRFVAMNSPPEYIVVDSHPVLSGWFSLDGEDRSLKRDITRHKCIRKFWQSSSDPNVTLGGLNTYTDTSDTALVQAHPYLDPNVYGAGFKNVGEIGMVFDVNGYNVPIGSTEADLRLDPNKPLYAGIFNYLTVFDPANHGYPNETRVKGRININTAPSFVLEQLPWIAPPAVGPAIVDMVVAYRDKQITWVPGLPNCFKPRSWHGFASIGELTTIQASGIPGFYGMDYYADPNGSPGDQVDFPDLTPLKILGGRDGAADDYEERDLIFHRISNLITVRSDVFTAYILVRIGADGPQRRMLAILDRSNVAPHNVPPYTTGRVNIRALHKVADPW